jgi:hypothetical protein
VALISPFAFGDARYDDLRELVRKSAIAKRLPMPEMPAPLPFLADSPQSVALGDFGAAIVAFGIGPTTGAGCGCQRPSTTWD